MEIILSASSVIFPSKICRLDVLKDIFDKIYIPQAVLGEINASGSEKQIRDIIALMLA